MLADMDECTVAELDDGRVYLNMRNNHMPLTSWGYSQAFETWTTGIGIPANLNAGEVTSQIASVLAAGGKGVQLFQSEVDLFKSDAAAWKAARASGRPSCAHQQR